MCVRTAGENAERNGVAEHFTVLVGDLSDKASGKYNIITANIVAAAILSLAPHVPVLMAPGARFIASGIIDTRKDEVLAAMQNGTLDCVTFGSSSTVENFLSLIPADELRAHPEVKLAAIGPVTAKTLADNGLPCHIQPEAYTIPALVEALKAHYSPQR